MITIETNCGLAPLLKSMEADAKFIGGHGAQFARVDANTLAINQERYNNNDPFWIIVAYTRQPDSRIVVRSSALQELERPTLEETDIFILDNPEEWAVVVSEMTGTPEPAADIAMWQSEGRPDFLRRFANLDAEAAADAEQLRASVEVPA